MELLVPFFRFVADLVEISKFGPSFIAPSFRLTDWHLSDKKKKAQFGVVCIEFWRRVTSGMDWTGATGPLVKATSARLIPLTPALTDNALETLKHHLSEFLGLAEAQDNTDRLDELVSFIWMSSEVINHIEISKFEEALGVIQDSSAKVFRQLKVTQARTNPRFFFRLQFLLSELLQAETLLLHTAPEGIIEEKALAASLVSLFGRMVDAVATNTQSVFLLRAFRLLLQALTAPSSKKSTITSVVLSSLAADSALSTRVGALQEKLQDNLMHKSQPLRAVSVGIFSLLNCISFFENIPTKFTQELFEEMQEIEDAQLNPLEARSITVRIHRLKEILLQQSPQAQQKEQKQKQKRSVGENQSSEQRNEAERVAVGDRELVLRFLFGIFRKKLVLLWPMTKEVLFFLAAQDYRRYWKILWPLFQTAVQRGPDHVAQEALKESDHSIEFESAEDSSDYTVEALSPMAQGSSGDFAKAVKVDEGNTEDLAFSKQLWECVTQLHKLTQHSAAEFRPIIDMFVSFIQEKYPHMQATQPRTANEVEVSHFMDRNSKTLLTEFLKFFSNFRLPSSPSALAQKLGYSGTALSTRGAKGPVTAPPHLHMEDNLFEIFVLLLTHGNETIQRLALDCIMLWKLEFLLPYRENLQRLCSSKDIREVVTAWRISTQAGEIQPQHRQKVTEYITNLVYPKLVAKGRHSTMLSSRRTALLSFLANLEPEELQPLIQLLFRAFNPVFEAKTREQRVAAAMAIDWKKQVGVLTLLEDLIKNMGRTLQASLPKIIPLVLSLLQAAITQRKNRTLPLMSQFVSHCLI
jgi:hypothetical protein